MSSRQKLKLVSRFPSSVSTSPKSASACGSMTERCILYFFIAGLPADQIQVTFQSSTCKVVAGPDDQAADPSGPCHALPVDQSSPEPRQRTAQQRCSGPCRLAATFRTRRGVEDGALRQGSALSTCATNDDESDQDDDEN